MLGFSTRNKVNKANNYIPIFPDIMPKSPPPPRKGIYLLHNLDSAGHNLNNGRGFSKFEQILAATFFTPPIEGDNQGSEWCISTVGNEPPLSP